VTGFNTINTILVVVYFFGPPVHALTYLAKRRAEA